MKIIKLEVGSLGTNCYIIYSEKTKNAMIVDPGGNAKQIMLKVNQENMKVKWIVLTHAHADHMSALEEVRKITGAELLVHEEDAIYLASPSMNLSAYMGEGFTVESADKLIKEGDVLEFDDVKFTVRHTPGHTPGGICLVGDEVVICGDTLFAESIGRTDFPGGSYRQLIASIKNKLMTLPDEYQVLPGHGPDTTIGWERNMNSFIQ